jgi:hypothetical protein
MAVSNVFAMSRSWHSLTDKGMTYNLIRLFSNQYRMRGSEFAELKAFAAVVERASFTRAADHLGLSPSAQEEGRQPALFKRLKSSDCFLP